MERPSRFAAYVWYKQTNPKIEICHCAINCIPHRIPCRHIHNFKSMVADTQLSLSTLLTFIYSFSALCDYLKLIVLGGAFETLRRLYSASYKSLVNRFFITATFESDVSYGELPFRSSPITELTQGCSERMMFWLSSRPQFRQFRNFSVSTVGPKNSSLEIDDNMDEGLQWRTPPIRYLPSYSSYWMWYKGRYITISRTKEESRWGSDKSILEITSVSSGYINCPISERLAEYFPAIVLS
jgi:mitochondrial chaperone BCS1